MSMVKALNAAPLTPELMKRLMMLLDAMPSEQRAALTGRSVGLIAFLQEQYPDQDPVEQASVITAFEFRMLALTELRTRPEYRAWSLQSSTQKQAPDLVQQVLIDAAAVEPLIQRSKKPAFDPASFFNRALALSEAKGRA